MLRRRQSTLADSLPRYDCRLPSTMAYTGAQQVQGSSWAAQHSRLAACLALLLLHSAHVHAHRCAPPIT
jgi:hypothetical protein